MCKPRYQSIPTGFKSSQKVTKLAKGAILQTIWPGTLLKLESVKKAVLEHGVASASGAAAFSFGVVAQRGCMTTVPNWCCIRACSGFVDRSGKSSLERTNQR